MNTLGVTLILLSTGLHAGWNLLGKGRDDKPSYFDRMLAWVAVVGFLPAAVGFLSIEDFPPFVVVCSLASGVFCGLYYFFLMRGYMEADFTVVYPVARALPVLALGLLDVARGRPPSAPGWTGMCLVTAGCILAPQTSIRGFTFGAYRRKALLFIVATATATVGYTFIDKIAAEKITAGGPRAAAVYGYLFFVFSWGVYRILIRSHGRRTVDKRPARESIVIPLAGAVMNFGAYWLVLWAYQLCSRAGYVVAFRQFSIVLGVIAALVLYREPGARVRLTAAFCITAGLVLIAAT